MTLPQLRAAIEGVADEMTGSGSEIGLQITVYRHGALLADIATGPADPETGAPVTPGTLFFAASTAKSIAATLTHTLAERGEIDYDLPLADAWPEFAAHRKHKITLRHVLTHTAGLPNLPPQTTPEDLCDWPHMCAVLAAARPSWPPGTRFGYHAKTFGFLLGETLRRATGRSITRLLRETVTEPLGIADEVHFGVPAALLPRVARQIPAAQPPPPPGAGTPAARAMPRAVQPTAAYANRTDILTHDIPSEGTMTARGAALIHAALLGHIDGVKLVSPQRLSAIAQITYRGQDAVMEVPTEWALGYSTFWPGLGNRPGSTLGMVGANGSAAWADIDTGIAVAVMRNHFAAGGAGGLETAQRLGRIIAGITGITAGTS